MDTIISQADQIRVLADHIKNISDDPTVLERILNIEAKAVVIMSSARNYRIRVGELKGKARANADRELLDSLADLGRRITEVAEGPYQKGLKGVITKTGGNNHG